MRMFVRDENRGAFIGVLIELSSNSHLVVLYDGRLVVRGMKVEDDLVRAGWSCLEIGAART